jgi:hypothetical protein
LVNNNKGRARARALIRSSPNARARRYPALHLLALKPPLFELPALRRCCPPFEPLATASSFHDRPSVSGPEWSSPTDGPDVFLYGNILSFFSNQSSLEPHATPTSSSTPRSPTHDPIPPMTAGGIGKGRRLLGKVCVEGGRPPRETTTTTDDDNRKHVARATCACW